jgi:FG-GAP-like repeat
MARRHRALSRRLRPLIWLILTTLALAQDDEYRVTPKFERRLDIEELLARVDPEKDAWIGERDFEAIHRKLDQIAQNLRQRQATLARLDEIARRFESLSVVELKITSSERASPEETRARVRLRIELAGKSIDGKLLSILGRWDSIWFNSDGDWKLSELSPGPLAETSSATTQFTDVTLKAIGQNHSFRAQLALGTDHWRTTLDEATGIDVYGHNGLAVGDYDGDGLEDLYICQPSGLPNRLYRNNGDATFTDVTVSAGVDVLDDTRTVLFADVENDGDQDLIAVTASQPLLFRNDGRGHFKFDPQSGLKIPESALASLTSAALADYDNDGYLDLYVCSYDFWQPGRDYNAPVPYYDATNGPPNFLFRNRRNGTFEDVTKRAGMMQNNNRYSFAAAWGDYDSDGHPDIYVANDFGRKNLYHNNGDGTFTDVAARTGVEDLGAGMSAAWGDYDNDGKLDLYVGNMWSSAGLRLTHNRQFRQVAPSGEVRASFQRQAQGNSLYRNRGDGTFTEDTEKAGVAMGRFAWGSDFLDFDNDGNLDLFVQNGYITGPDTHDL